MNMGKTTLALLLSMSVAAAFAGDKETVKYREDLMKVIGGHMGSIVAIIKGEVPHKGDLKYHTDGLAAAAPKVIPVFEAEAMTEKSHALPDIWSDWATFEEKAHALETASRDLAAAVDGGEMGAIGAALKKVGDSCKGCHDNFTEDDH